MIEEKAVDVGSGIIRFLCGTRIKYSIRWRELRGSVNSEIQNCMQMVYGARTFEECPAPQRESVKLMQARLAELRDEAANIKAATSDLHFKGKFGIPTQDELETIICNTRGLSNSLILPSKDFVYNNLNDAKLYFAACEQVVVRNKKNPVRKK